MKKLFTLFSFFVITNLSSQSSLNLWALDASQNSQTLTVNNGDTVYYTIAAGALETVFFQFQNVSAATHSYSVRRTDLIMNAGASAYFCFGDQGTCYPSTVTVSSGDYTTLAPGQSTTKSTGPPLFSDTNLSTDFQEGSTAGYSVVKYKLFDVTTGEMGADTMSWKIIYNQALGIQENKNVFKNVSDIYPNPATSQADITVLLANESVVKVEVYNSIGSLVYSGAEQRLSGKNKIAVDCNNFNSGLYFVTVTAGNSKVTKRMVVNK